MACLNCPTPFTKSSRTAVSTMTFAFWEDEFFQMPVRIKKLLSENSLRSWFEGDRIFFEIPKLVAAGQNLNEYFKRNLIQTPA